MANLEFYEREVVEIITGNVTFEDLHRVAWRVFLDGQVPDKPASQPHPFIFRFDESESGRYQILIRSEQAFPHSEKCSISLKEGDTLVIRWLGVASQRVNSDDSRKNNPLRAVPPWQRSLWITDQLEKRGTVVEGVLTSARPHRRVFAGKPVNIAQVEAEAEITIKDPIQFAENLVNGFGRKRGYGNGMIEIIGREGLE